MEMHQIRYFLAVARTLNFTRAAVQCNVTQPSLTRAIQKLEDEFGGPLFNRERSLTHLTELGRLVQPHLEQTFEAAEAATSLAGSIGRAEVTPLVIGIANGLVLPGLAGILSDLSERLPGLAIDLRGGTSDHLVEQALKGGIDLLVVSLCDEAPERLETWALFRQDYGMVTWAGHRLAQVGDVTVADQAAEVTIACDNDGTALWRRTAARAGIETCFQHRSETVALALHLIAMRLGSAILPVGVAGPDLTVVRSTDHDLSLPVVLGAIAGRRRGRAADAFVRAARALDWQRGTPEAPRV